MNAKSRRWALNLGLALAGFGLACLVLEGLSLRLAPLPAPVRLREGLYVSSLPLISANPSCRWRPSVKGEALPLARRPGERRVFVFGESSVEGTPWKYRASPPTMLYDRLSELPALGPLTVVNMGRACSSMVDSYYYLLSIAPYRPDIIVFYQGSNDGFGRYDENCLPSLAAPLHAAWRFLVERSHLLRALRMLTPDAAIRRRGLRAGKPLPPGEPRCDPRKTFRRWTDILVRTARGLGAEVIVTTPVRSPLTGLEFRAWQPESPPLAQALEGRDEFYRKLLRCELTAGCDMDRLAEALPQDNTGREIEERAAAWRESAAAYGARFVDFSPGLNLFIGETHLSIEGYRLLSSRWSWAAAGMLGGADIAETAAHSETTLRRYERDLRAEGRPVEEIFYQEGLSYLNARMFLLAAPPLEEAARRAIPEAKLGVAWLRQRVGLRPDIPAALRSRWRSFDADALPSRRPR